MVEETMIGDSGSTESVELSSTGSDKISCGSLSTCSLTSETASSTSSLTIGSETSGCVTCRPAASGIRSASGLNRLRAMVCLLALWLRRTYAVTRTSKVPEDSVTPDVVGVRTTLKPEAVLLDVDTKHAWLGVT